jgi:hypothetical protein
LGVCPIDLDNNADVRLHDGHGACRECLVNHVNACVDEGSGDRIPVPCPVCDDVETTVRLLSEDLRPHLPADVMRRLLKTEFRLAGLTLVHCPACNEAMEMPAVPQVRISRGSLAVRCASRQCGQRFCLDCEQPWHSGRRCAAIEAAEAARQQEEAQTRRALIAEGSFTRCPCGTIVQRSTGCNHMKHVGCSLARVNIRLDGTTHFCFVCGRELRSDGRTDNATGGSHFPNGVFSTCGRSPVGVSV